MICMIRTPTATAAHCGNTITIIDTVGNGNPADYVYGIEGMSFDDPTLNESGRPPFAPNLALSVSAAFAVKLRTSQPAL